MQVPCWVVRTQTATRLGQTCTRRAALPDCAGTPRNPSWQQRAVAWLGATHPGHGPGRPKAVDSVVHKEDHRRVRRHAGEVGLEEVERVLGRLPAPRPRAPVAGLARPRGAVPGRPGVQALRKRARTHASTCTSGGTPHNQLGSPHNCLGSPSGCGSNHIGHQHSGADDTGQGSPHAARQHSGDQARGGGGGLRRHACARATGACMRAVRLRDRGARLLAYEHDKVDPAPVPRVVHPVGRQRVVVHAERTRAGLRCKGVRRRGG